MGYRYVLKMADGEHSRGKEISTKRRLPIALEVYAAVQSEATACRLDKYLKTSSGKATYETTFRLTKPRPAKGLFA
jgi:hypothetical protein